VVCDEGRKRARGLARSLFEGTRVGRAIGAVGGKGRLRAGESAHLSHARPPAPGSKAARPAAIRAPHREQADSSGARPAASSAPSSNARNSALEGSEMHSRVRKSSSSAKSRSAGSDGRVRS